MTDRKKLMKIISKMINAATEEEMRLIYIVVREMLRK